MTLERRTGDLFAASGLDALGHGCNCAGAMGRGIAVEFKRRWPGMYTEYRARCRDGRLTLGSVFPWQADGLVIYNLGTQAHWRTPAEMWAIESSVRVMLEHAEANDVHRIGIPQIGAGLGGLKWPDVESAIASVVDAHDVTVVVHSLQHQ